MVQLSYRRHRFPAEIIQHAIWLHLRFTLSLLRGKQDEKTYCLTGECSRDVKRCLTKRAPVASLILRPSRSSFSGL